jgi:hypothetical protein
MTGSTNGAGTAYRFRVLNLGFLWGSRCSIFNLMYSVLWIMVSHVFVWTLYLRLLITPLVQLTVRVGYERNFTTKEMSFPLWTFHLYVETFQQHLHIEYISLSWSDIPELVVPICIPSQGHYGFHSFPVVDWFCLFIYLWVLTFPL